jgi:4-amino-4-deoxy-L-arabinose transferase-like glycosyltransferase
MWSRLQLEPVGNSFRAGLLLILLASGFFIFWGLGAVDLFDPDQGMWGSIAQEMVKGGDWITPHFDGVRYLEKPPLYFWLTALTLSLFGPSEWVIKLWSALPALGTAILTYRLGQLFYGGPAALLSALVMISSVEVLQYARKPLPDFLLVFSITLAMYGFVKSALFTPSLSADGQPQTDNGRLSLLFYAGIALAVLSKGLIGVIFPIVIVGLFFWFSGEHVTWRQCNLTRGLTLFFVLVLPWHLLAAWKNPGFLWFYFVDNQFLRFLNRRAYMEEDVPLTTLAFLANILIWILPWSVVLPAALREAIPRSRLAAARIDRVRLLVGLWALTVIGFFCLSSSKLEHYFLPAIVPLSLMAGKVWGDEFGSPGTSTALKWCLGIAALLFPLLGGGLVFLALHLTPDGVLRSLAKVDIYYRSPPLHR